MALTLFWIVIILGLVYGFLLMCIVFMLFSMRKNNIMISINEFKHGVLLNYTIRCRANKKKDLFYPMSDIFSRKPIKIKDEVLKPSKLTDDEIIIESLPVIGVKINIELIVNENSYNAWKIKEIDSDKGIIDNIRTVKINSLRTELYDMTDNTTKAEVLQKIIIPAMLIVLALACIVFFPKIYEAIQGSASSAFQSSMASWQTTIASMAPVG